MKTSCLSNILSAEEIENNLQGQNMTLREVVKQFKVNFHALWSRAFLVKRAHL